MTLLPLHASDCLEKSVKKICYGSEIETLNLSICKKKLEVKRHTSSIKALTELARTPFKYWWNKNCVKSVRTRSYSGLHFPAFGLNAERYSVSLRIQFECGKMQTRITPNTDTFYAVRNIQNTFKERLLHEGSTWGKSPKQTTLQ